MHVLLPALQLKRPPPAEVKPISIHTITTIPEANQPLARHPLIDSVDSGRSSKAHPTSTHGRVRDGQSIPCQASLRVALDGSEGLEMGRWHLDLGPHTQSSAQRLGGQPLHSGPEITRFKDGNYGHQPIEEKLNLGRTHQFRGEDGRVQAYLQPASTMAATTSCQQRCEM